MVRFTVSVTTTRPFLSRSWHYLSAGFAKLFRRPDPPHRNNRGFPRSSHPPNRNTLRNSGAMLRLARARKPGFSGLWRCCGWRGNRRKIPREGVLELCRGVTLRRGAASEPDALRSNPEWLQQLCKLSLADGNFLTAIPRVDLLGAEEQRIARRAVAKRPPQHFLASAAA
jgi:hypothetical protein